MARWTFGGNLKSPEFHQRKADRATSTAPASQHFHSVEMLLMEEIGRARKAAAEPLIITFTWILM
jgi:hypothetical protein